MSNAKVSEVYIAFKAQTAEFRKALEDAGVQTKKFAGATRQSMEEARGSVMLLNDLVGVRMPRELTRAIAGMKGISEAISAAFSAVAILAFIKVVYEAGEKIAEFIQKNRESAEKLKTSQEEFGATVQKTYNSYAEKLLQAGIQADDLRGNHLAALHKELQLIDMQGFDQLESAFKSLESAADKAFDNIKTNWLSTVTQMSWSQAQGFKGTLDRFGSEYSLLLAQGKGDEAQKLLNTTQQREEQNRADLVTVRASGLRTHYGYAPGNSSLDQAINRLRANGISDFSDETYNAATNTTVALEAQQKIVDYQRRVTAADKSGALSKFGKSADKDQLDALKATLAEKELILGKDLAFEADYWAHALTTLHKGSDAYKEALNNEQQAWLGLMQQYHKQIAASNKANSFNVAPNLGKADSTERGSDQLFAATVRNTEAQAQINAEWDAANDKLGLLTGRITAHQAAMDAASDHAKEYGVQIAALYAQLRDLHKDDDLAALFGGVDDGTKAKEQVLQTQIDQLQAKGRITAMEDAQNVLSTTWKGMIDDVWDELIRRAQNTQQQLASIASRTIDSLNNEMAKAVTGQRTNFSGVFYGAAQGLAKTGLEKVEGVGLSALGINKKKADGYHVFVDNMPKGPGSTPGIASTGRGLLGMLNDSNWAGSLFGGKLFGAGSFFGHFAGGGDVSAGVPVMTGELGPEIFTPSVPGHITPHAQSFGNTNNVAIDARGANDPAAVQAAVDRSMAAYLPHLSGASRAAIADNNRRLPSGSRGRV